MRSRPRGERTPRQQRAARGDRGGHAAEEPRYQQYPRQHADTQYPGAQYVESQYAHDRADRPSRERAGRGSRSGGGRFSQFSRLIQFGGGGRAGHGERARRDIRPDLRKRRRPPKSDWQLPLLTDLELRPEQQRFLVIIASVGGVLLAMVSLIGIVGSLGAGTGDQGRLPTAAMAGQEGPGGPTAFHGWTSPEIFAPIADRAKDARPLSQRELFTVKSLTRDKTMTLKLVESEVAAECAPVLWGDELRDRVALAECSQAARGLYTSADNRYVAQYTLLNLRDSAAADALVAAFKTLHVVGWVRPLPNGSAPFPRGAYSEGGAYALGHYVGIVWVARRDGAEPEPGKDDFVSLSLALRDAEKPLYRRVVAVTGSGGG